MTHYEYIVIMPRIEGNPEIISANHARNWSDDR
ncbi:Uncharacterised protein [Mycobacteroides abscessus subsp. abscessus]|nr:Uncharacterised protein [Mycobacteroides abscessus subsp. abscessus]SLI38128.1 Uncharacterised protein [Mycobacteroides abscessus subsp. abscessus]